MSVITIKKLSEHYKIYSRDNGKTQILEHLTENGSYNVGSYQCHIFKVKPAVYRAPNFEPTDNFETLLENIKTYTASLKYRREFYSPLFRNGYFEYMAVWDYLRDFGFKSGDDDYFYLESKNVYGKKETVVSISIVGLDFSARKLYDELPEKVEIMLYSGEYSWVSIKEIPRHPDNIIAEIEGLLKPLFLINAANNFKMSEKFKAKDLNLTINSVSGLNAVSKDYKEELKKSLQEALDALK